MPELNIARLQTTANLSEELKALPMLLCRLGVPSALHWRAPRPSTGGPRGHISLYPSVQ